MKEVKTPKKPLAYYYGIVLIVLIVFNLVVTPILMKHQVKETDYGTFMSMIEKKNIGEVEVKDNQIIFTDKDQKNIYKTGLMNDPNLTDRLYECGAVFAKDIDKQMSPIISFLLTGILPLILFIALGNYMAKKLMEHAGGKNSMAFGMGKSNAKIYVQSSEGIRFSDVAGEDEAKENLSEIVDYLHNPKKYTDVGASMPKGVLLVGPPGTGKTMLAKAVAGESNVPFFSMSGSEFVEMFVGMGASKVRDLFRQAKEKAPCIVFIDEIDAIGKKRDGQMGGNDEREQTLNQLLTEMDGFEGNNGVIILAATNRPESLDPALTRPGRFDRRVPVELPDLAGREAILKVHAKKIKASDDVDLHTIARMASGASGAELANIINEAALRAVRSGRSGSEFVEMFVGMGASKVRDLFRQAKEKAPCIVFIDEIDAIGKKRDGQMGGNDEREQTLNQLLTEMDGFEGNNGVIILAATNRPESLDPALTRPGRFDRRVPVELPDLAGREAILKVHAKKIKASDDVDLHTIARMASGASGAELANIINEAALRAVRSGRTVVNESDLEESIEVVIAGYQKKNAVLSDQEKKVVAYHEIGHALVAALQSHSAPVQKITIIPRTSGALGYTMQVEQGDKYLMTKKELENKIATFTGGRAAEEIVFGEITTGASNDIEQATKIARAMITRYGMTDEFDMVAMENVTNQYLGGDTSLSCSEDTQKEIDEKVVQLVKAEHEKARKILAENREKLDELAMYLYEKETITGDEFMDILDRK